jgi:hypothetical protein
MKISKRILAKEPKCGNRKTFTFFAFLPVSALSQDGLIEHTIWLEHYNVCAIYSGTSWIKLGNYIIE